MNGPWLKTLLSILAISFLITGSVQAAQPEQQGLVDDAGAVSVDPSLRSKEETTAYSNRAAEVFSAGIESAPLSDRYGYTWSDTVELTWDSISDSGSDLSITGDDTYSGQVVFPAGFVFPFYENEYNSLYVTDNGWLSFNAPSSGYAPSNNMPIPFEGPPQNIIAPLWDDLRPIINPDDELTDSKAYSYFDSTDPQRLIIEWNSFYLISGQEPFTFQAILYRDGKVCFQYRELPELVNAATVGIEDADGVDGLQYLYNEEGLTSLVGTERALCYERPVSSWRVKVLPYYQGGFSYINPLSDKAVQQFEITIKNIGNKGPDKFEIEASDTSWDVSFSDVNLMPLPDSDNDGIKETGVLAEGEQKTVLVNVTSPKDPAEGRNVEIVLDITSMNDLTVQQAVKIQTAVPVAFTEALINPELSGISMNFYWKHNFRSSRVAGVFTGATMSIVSTPDGGYIYTWERNLTKQINTISQNYVDIEYARISSLGVVTPVIYKLTDNYSSVTATTRITDRYPVLAVNPAGTFGAVWTRSVITGSGPTATTLSNVYLKLSGGGVSTALLNVTGNTASGSDAPTFDNPRITVLENGNFVLVWVKRTRIDVLYQEEIYGAYYSAAGVQLIGPTLLVSGGLLDVHDVNLTPLTGGGFLLSYTLTDSATQANQVYSGAYTINSSSFHEIKRQALLDAVGKHVDALELTPGNVLIAWTATPENQIEYAVLNPSNLSYLKDPASLPAPNGRLVDYVSVGKNADGYAFLTWLDTDLYRQLFYAAFDLDGSLITPQMPFLTLDIEGGLVVNDSGYSSASFGGAFLTSLPLIKR